MEISSLKQDKIYFVSPINTVWLKTKFWKYLQKYMRKKIVESVISNNTQEKWQDFKNFSLIAAIQATPLSINISSFTFQDSLPV